MDPGKVLQLSVDRDPVFRIEDPVVELPHAQHAALQPLPEAPDPAAGALAHPDVIRGVLLLHVLARVEHEVGGGGDLVGFELGEPRREEQLPEGLHARLAVAAG